MKFHYNKHTKTQLSQLLPRIGNAIYEPIADLTITAWRTKEPVPFDQRQSGEKLYLKVGDKWGDLFDCAWFQFVGQAPKSAAGKKVVLMIDLSGEALVVDGKGNPELCLTTISSIFDRRLGLPGKNIVPWLEQADGGEEIAIWADAGNNDLFGNLQNNGTIQQAAIAVCHEELRELYYDYEVLHNLLQQLPEDSARYQRILYGLYKASIRMNEFTEAEAKLARADLAPELKKQNGDYSLQVSAIGHAHLDLAWLWPIRETIRKGARTFANVLKLMDRFPDFKFGASQAQLYQWMKDYYPSLYARVKEKIAEGRWDILGATWVEPDTNIIGGESFVRQFLYGKKFFKTEFGKNIDLLCLPDSFGYTGALPQMMKKCGVDYFMTIKLSWDRYNVYPNHSFFWQGIDGSRVLVHMPPEGTYNSSALPEAIKKMEREYLDKAVSENCLLVYGIGDGGGGPGEEHLERLQREKNLEGIAPVTQDKLLPFFQRLETEQENFQTWVGELYLGMHQGTYTTQGRSKWFNRKLEIALREAEFWASLAAFVTDENYPQQELEAIWKELLLYQFHDILPGSSITRVYDESLARYAMLVQQVNDLIENFQTPLFRQINTSDFEQPIIFTNSLSWERNEWVKIDEHWFSAQVPAMGYATIEQKDSHVAFPPLLAQSFLLENDILLVKFNEDGTIISVFDNENQREVIQTGTFANELAIYHDDGDAWDFPADYEYRVAGKFELVSSEAFLDGPQAVMKQVRQYGNSTMTQKIILTAGSRRIDFETEVEWDERHKMLRASFPVAVQATESVSEIQFGNIKRPTSQNTDWERAKFEICAHKWIDISQADYGVAVLNDSKYGFKVFGNVLDIDLLRSPGLPDPQADRGTHRFTYSLFPHAGDHISGGVVRAGYELNVPIKAIPTAKHSGKLPDKLSFFAIDSENVIIETIKKAEANDDFILRLYEAFGMHKEITVHSTYPIQSAQLTNMLEEKIRQLDVKSNSFSLEFKPFEIHTVRLKLEY